MEIDKLNGHVGFRDSDHIYFDIEDPDKRYISVTTLIHSFTQPFDKDFWSAYKALETLLPKDSWILEKKSLLNTKVFDKSILDLYDISENDFNKVQQDILDAWDEENRKSCERGTKIHSEIENSFYKKPKNISLNKFGIGGKFECKKDYSELDLDFGVYPEYLVYRESDDGILRIAGQIDLIAKAGNEITIIDHKGLPLDTPILTSEGWSTMKDLKIGDKVFDKEGNLCNVIVKSSVHNNPCCKINFDNGESIVADIDHRWEINYVTSEGNIKTKIMTTAELKTEVHNKPFIANPKPLKTTLNISEHTTDFHKYLASLGYNSWIENDIVKYCTKPRTIISVVDTETVPTQCISVDSPSHTYLCTYSLIVTHNTNKKIETKSFYNSKTRTSTKMKYPLNTLDDVNFNHYALQLSTYAWMLQKINPEFVIKDLILNHYDHNGNNTLYHCPYLKNEVERMLCYYKKQLILQEQKNKRKRIEY